MTILIGLSLLVNLFAIQGDDCADPIPASLPFYEHRTTSDFTNHLDLGTGCTGHTTSGRDIIYEWTNNNAFPCTVAVMAVPIGMDPMWNISIYVLDQCDPPNCIRGQDFFGPGAPETLTVELPPGGTYYFVIDGRDTDDHGMASYSVSSCYHITGVDEGSQLEPYIRPMLDVVPNPSDGIVDFAFALNHGSEVSLEVYDGTGRFIWGDQSSYRDVGDHVIRWNGLNADGIPAAPGVYLAKLKSEDIDAIRTFIIVR